MKKKGRQPIALPVKTVQKVNFLWFTNQRNLTDIAKIVGHSPPVVQRHLFKYRSEWEKWEQEQVQNGAL